MLAEGVNRGLVSLPLSAAHYMETQNRRDWRSRRELAETMLAFSKLHTIAPQEKLLPAEVDRALRERFGQPLQVRELRPFGVGASHAFGMPIGPYRVPKELRGTLADVGEFERKANRFLEEQLLIGPSPELEEEGIPGYEPFSHLQIGERYAKAKEELREVRKVEGWQAGERSQRVAKAQAFVDHLPVLQEALARAGLQEDALLVGGQDGMSTFLEKVPTMLASSELERQRHVSSQKTWERQDLTDLGALSVAMAHCDIVVTERFWTDAARRSRLGEKLGTVVISNLEDLPLHLVG